MKKSLIFWFAAATCAALFLVGCESPTDGAPGAAGRIGDGHVGGEVSVAGLQAMIDRYVGTGAELVLDNVEVAGEGVVDFKTVKAYVVGPLATENNADVTILKLLNANITFGEGGQVALGHANDVAIGTAAQFVGKGATGSYAAPAANDVLPGTAAEVGGVTAVENLTLSATATSIPAGLTVYVYGNLTVDEDSVQPTQGKVVVIGTVTLAETPTDTTALASNTYVDVNNAEIVIGAGATSPVEIGLPDSVDGPRFYLAGEQDVLEVAGATTKFAAHVRGNGLLKLVAAVTDVTIIGNGKIHFADDANAATAFAAGSSVTARTITFDDGFTSAKSDGIGNVTLDGAVYIVAGKTIAYGYNASTVTLAAGTTVSTTEGTPALALRAVSDLKLTSQHAETAIAVNAGGVVEVKTQGATFDGDVVFGSNLTLTAVPATFGGTAYFGAGKKIVLSAGTSIITLEANTGALAYGTPTAGVPHIYNTVLIANDTAATLTPSAGLDLTFDATNKGISQPAGKTVTLGGTATLVGGSYTVNSADASEGKLTVFAAGVLTLGPSILASGGLPAVAAPALVLVGAATNPAALVLDGASGTGAKLVVDNASATQTATGTGIKLVDAAGTVATAAPLTGTSVVLKATATTMVNTPIPLGTIQANSSADNDTTIKGPGAGNNSAIAHGWKIVSDS